MHYKNRKQAIEYILKKHLKSQDNLLLSQRLFLVNSVLIWVFNNTNNQAVIKSYLNDLEKYIEGRIELPWAEEVITKKER